MISRRYKVFFSVGALIVISWLTLAFLDPNAGRGISETIGAGYFFGSLFAHTTLAAAWSAIGPGPLLWRMPLSLVWVALLAVAININIKTNGGPDGIPVIVGACLLAEWLLLQFPLWGLKLGFRLHRRHLNESQRAFDPQQWQFGIRQLIIVTTIVGVAFGIGRLLLANLHVDFGGVGPIVLFLAAAAIVITLPLLLAGLMERRALAGIALALVMIIAGTVLEWPLLNQPGFGPGLEVHLLLAINSFSAVFILVVVVAVRRCGYRLTRLERSALQTKL